MNSMTNWFDQDASSAHQEELYRAANNQRLANEAGKPARRNIYTSAMASLGKRMILWGTRLQKRAYQPTITQQMKAV